MSSILSALPFLIVRLSAPGSNFIQSRRRSLALVFFCTLAYGGSLRYALHRAEAEEQMNSATYWWQGAYECAVLETNPARMATLIDDALYAIEQRLGSTVRLDQVENEAIEAALNELAFMRGNTAKQQIS